MKLRPGPTFPEVSSMVPRTISTEVTSFCTEQYRALLGDEEVWACEGYGKFCNCYGGDSSNCSALKEKIARAEVIIVSGIASIALNLFGN